ncbi:uncharacterized protein BDR25DRAFT_350070 [Lindgomyces ingoldianus]|uniref:Uncharacterized protein n=1 Tax=Lindgomyces ingoldianus TaxID=673940 RepID=A0ACB6R941_9PLEO|nr:uncharacterized protein BDR25DRAFT_350070 [Lindgomyces ingoldianus]KAF2475784.1 hypothetical protein BDR25DRAFT_350070 [Lindgomyces ingoldianus]
MYGPFLQNLVDAYPCGGTAQAQGPEMDPPPFFSVNYQYCGSCSTKAGKWIYTEPAAKAILSSHTRATPVFGRLYIIIVGVLPSIIGRVAQWQGACNQEIPGEFDPWHDQQFFFFCSHLEGEKNETLVRAKKKCENVASSRGIGTKIVLAYFNDPSLVSQLRSRKFVQLALDLKHSFGKLCSRNTHKLMESRQHSSNELLCVKSSIDHPSFTNMPSPQYVMLVHKNPGPMIPSASKILITSLIHEL